MRVISCLFVEHNLWLVALAAVVCVSGSAITFGLYRRARERTGLQTHGWIFLTAVAAGSSIWCTHFIAMLAYEVRVPVTFDPILTMASLVMAMVGCGLGFGLSAIDAKRFPPLACGVIVGLSVALMHYTGMAAYHVSGLVEWNPAYVIASVAISASVAAVALREAVLMPRAYSHFIAMALFVAAIVGLHFTAMAAVQVTPMAPIGPDTSQDAFAAMAVAVAGVGLMVIGTGVASYLIDERTSADTIRQLQHMALNDALTGLPNRVQLRDYLDRELERAKENGWTIAVLGIDLDGFKEINDLHGHEAGDQTLKAISQRLETLLQPGEFVARVGGDEFSAIKRYGRIEDLHDFVARLERALSQPVQLGSIEAVIGGSIGVALFPQDGDSASTLVSNADLAMYRAKSVKRIVCFYEKQMDEAARERKALAADLRRAIDLGELSLHYQVQNSVRSGDISGYEVLLRWNHRERGMINPALFIPLAEECGAIVEIGDWVLRTACQEALSQPQMQKIAVNVSAVQLAHGDFAQRVHSILVETGFSPRRLELEITETAIIADKARALRLLRRIRGLGVTIAIDDFGAGYSSLETLRTFPFDKIKLDRSFIQDLGRHAQAKAIFRAVLALGKSLDIPVLAEGVETDEQLAILRREGCDEAQGYLLGRPAPMLATVAASCRNGSAMDAALP